MSVNEVIATRCAKLNPTYGGVLKSAFLKFPQDPLQKNPHLQNYIKNQIILIKNKI